MTRIFARNQANRQALYNSLTRAEYCHLLIGRMKRKIERETCITFAQLISVTDKVQYKSLCKKGCYTRLYNIVIQVVIQYLLYTLRIIVYNCV